MAPTGGGQPERQSAQSSRRGSGWPSATSSRNQISPWQSKPSVANVTDDIPDISPEAIAEVWDAFRQHSRTLII